MNIVVGVEGIFLTLLDDQFDEKFSTPVSKLVLSQIDAAISFFDSKQPVHAKMDLYSQITTLLFYYYNTQLSCYEPLIEPWALEFQFTKEPEKNSIHIVAPEIININMSKAILKSIYDAVDLSNNLIDRFSQIQPSQALAVSKFQISKKKISRSDVSFHPYVVRNRTGSQISFWTTSVFIFYSMFN